MKYSIEKTLHEIIRDLPEAQKISTGYERGLLAIDSALAEIAAVIRAERNKERDTE